MSRNQTKVRLLQRLSAIGNHDFCPWMNRYVYWLKQPIGWFVLAAVSAALAALSLNEPRAWTLFGSLIAVMLLGIIWPWLAIRGTEAEIEFDCLRCREGDHVQVRLAIHNRYPWPLWGLAVENGFFLASTDGSRLPVAALAQVPGWSRSEFVFEFRPDSRGVYPHQPPELATEFPFGIWRASRPISVQRELLVWPRTTPLTSIPSFAGEIADVIGMLFDRSGHEGDVIGIRPYRDGDRLRNIQWAQTARCDALMVTERQAAARRLIVVMVDLAAFPNCSLDETPQNQSLDTPIRVAASIAQEFHAHHADLRFVVGDIDLRLSPGTPRLHRLFDALARFQHEESVVDPPCTFGVETLTIVLTTSQRRTEWESKASKSGLLRLVVFGEADDASRAHVSRPGRHNAWLAIDRGTDELRQLRHQWERVCHDSMAK